MAATDAPLTDHLKSPSLLGYQLRLGSKGMPFDEMVGPDGSVRAHWRDVAGFFARLGPEEITRRWNQARKILHDNGAAYNAQSRGLLRPWELNPVPLCLPSGEWQTISKAIRQRVRLLNCISLPRSLYRLSQCPDFVDGRLESRSIVLRVFAVRSGADYELMPGGLTRVVEEESSYGALMLPAGGSKDTWVDTEDEASNPPGPVRAVELQRTHLDLTSRVADNLFWLGRYADRAEFTARIVRCALENYSEEPRDSATTELRGAI